MNHKLFIMAGLLAALIIMAGCRGVLQPPQPPEHIMPVPPKDNALPAEVKPAQTSANNSVNDLFKESTIAPPEIPK